jgi:PPOX class probable F420-dependent enzyme
VNPQGQLDPYVVDLVNGNSLGIVVTLMSDGRPQALPTWIDTDGVHLLVNTEPQRQRVKNLARDARVTVLVQSLDDQAAWAEVRGTLIETIGGQQAREHIDQLAQKYIGTDYDASKIGPQGRIILKILAEHVNMPIRRPE